MPIELWWWIRPLLMTGFVTVVILGIIALILIRVEQRWSDILAVILTAIAVAPILASCGSAVVWFFANILVSIWRC